MSTEHNRIFFNEKAGIWDKMVNHNPEKIRLLLSKLELKSGERVLDVGTGTGVLLPYLLELIGEEGRITALDLAENMIAEARRKYDSEAIEFIVGDAACLALPAETFDAVVCYSVYPHFPDPETVLANLGRMLRGGGRLLVCHSESRETINNRHKGLEKNLISHVLPPAQEVARVFEKAGLRVLDKADQDEYYYVLATK